MTAGLGRYAFVLPLAIGVVALVLVGYFDLATGLALNDEWEFRFPLMALQSGHGLRLWPGILPLSLDQLTVAAPLAIAGLDPRYWRLTVLPFVVLASVCSYLLAERRGADRFWSAVAAVMLLASPVALSMAAGFASDVAYIGLMLAALVAGQSWLLKGRSRLLFLVLVVLATVQRQHGLTLPVGLAAGLLVARRRRQVTRSDLIWLAAAFFAVAIALAVPFVTGLASATQGQVASGQGRLLPGPGRVLAAFVEFGPVLGLLFLPLLMALMVRPQQRDVGTPVFVWGAAVLSAAGLALATVWTFVVHILIYPGLVFGVWGLGPLYLHGTKPGFISLPVILVIEALSVVCFLVILSWRRDLWSVRSMGPDGVMLVVTSIAQIPLMWFTSPLDRYYLTAFMPLVPLLCAAAAMAGSNAGAMPRLARVGRWWAVIAILAGVAYFIPAQSDYVAWQGARDRAARAAYTLLPKDRVGAGYEAVGTYVAVPSLLATGRSEVDIIDATITDPILTLEFGGADDPRPGVAWSSVRPGKIVFVCARDQSACPTAGALESAVGSTP